MGGGVSRGRDKGRVLSRWTQLWIGIASAGLASACSLQNPGFSGGAATSSASEGVTTEANTGSTGSTGTTTDGGSGSETGSTGSTGSTSGGLTSAGPTSSGGDTTTDATTTDTTTVGGCMEKTDQAFPDKDDDGFGKGEPIAVCAGNPPPGYADNNDDCDDSNPDVNPGTNELCDEIDNNCNGIINEFSEANKDCKLFGDTCYLKEYDGHYYYACARKTWPFSVNDMCKNLTGDMAYSYHIKISSEAENNAMQSLLNTLGSDASIGLFDILGNDIVEGFLWVADDSKLEGEFGDPLQAPPWKNGAPDKKGETWTKIRAGDLRWDDIGGLEANPFICEAEPIAP